MLQPFLDHCPVIAIKFNNPVGYHTCRRSTKARQFAFYCLDVPSNLSNLCENKCFVEALNCIHWYVIRASSLHLSKTDWILTVSEHTLKGIEFVVALPTDEDMNRKLPKHSIYAQPLIIYM